MDKGSCWKKSMLAPRGWLPWITPNLEKKTLQWPKVASHGLSLLVRGIAKFADSRCRWSVELRPNYYENFIS